MSLQNITSQMFNEVHELSFRQDAARTKPYVTERPRVKGKLWRIPVMQEIPKGRFDNTNATTRTSTSGRTWSNRPFGSVPKEVFFDGGSQFKDAILDRKAVSYTHLTLPTTPYV